MQQDGLFFSGKARYLAYVVLLVIGSLSFLLFLMLMEATGNDSLFERNYQLLFVANTSIAALLGGLILFSGWRLWLRLRQGRFGSRLLLKLAMVFALVGVVPGLIIYVVSFQFVSRSIETWFDVKVERALDAGLNLGRSALEVVQQQVEGQVRQAVQAQFNNWGVDDAPSTLSKLADQLELSQMQIIASNGRVVNSVARDALSLAHGILPSSAQIKQARRNKSSTWFVGLEDAADGVAASPQVAVLVALPTISWQLSAEERYVLVLKPLPKSLVTNALAVEVANREYQEKALARKGLQRMYIGTLTLSLFLAVFSAIMFAILLSNQIAKPLLLLTEGVNQVAAGDLTPKLILPGKDELGGLTRAFASMTEQLAEARATVEQSIAELDKEKNSIQTIIDSLSAGIIVLDEAGVVRNINPSLGKVLAQDVTHGIGQTMAQVPELQVLAGVAEEGFYELFEMGSSPRQYWQKTLESDQYAGVDKPAFAKHATLMLRGAFLPAGGRLLVVDDITQVVSAQRAQAWGEVARRLAHEIKNPLTPIQLSAERLERKLTGTVSPEQQQLVSKSVRTIVEQVAAMQRLVDEFRDFSRMPTAQKEPTDINRLVLDIAEFYESSPDVGLVLQLDETNPVVALDSGQIRQVLHNLIQNAQDAVTEVKPDDGGETTKKRIWVTTAVSASGSKVRLRIGDEGPGFPDFILNRAFEPYVTTKTKGTGLGLAVVKKIADEHGARVELGNRVEDGKVIGAMVSLSFPLQAEGVVVSPA
ncbi:HAMP domain-containing protein [Curvibacter sp. CHRR-16]|uniref:sensor histidine kinase n=1 Tax=Curvibacter sp. CHRR-16 TaxID=2835872 RepID=UPI001BDA52D8|nr:ATP-binding protein [Curvibacter sp. CHRR-16]MBT0571721.1 HAMP domain-containing protein [Curvibacter sp. CHRR-16]